jgi:hypothetical protein
MKAMQGVFQVGMIVAIMGLIGSCMQLKTIPQPEVEEPVIEVVAEPDPIIDVQREIISDPKPESQDGTIVMYTRDGCVWCERWKQVELPKVLRSFWKFREVYTSEGPVPRFEIFGRGKAISHTGYMDMPTLRRIVDSM